MSILVVFACSYVRLFCISMQHVFVQVNECMVHQSHYQVVFKACTRIIAPCIGGCSDYLLQVVENLTNSTLNLAYQGLGENGAKALAKSLMVSVSAIAGPE